MSLESFLIVGAVIFSIGLYGALTKRNAITVLMCVELMFNGVIVTAVAFSRYVLPASLTMDPSNASDAVAQLLLTGHVFTIFIITVAAAEVALGLAIVVAIYRTRQSVLVSDVDEMRR